ncbi:hypothetical protein Tco_1172499 [Tanacetum coccineum]
MIGSNRWNWPNGWYSKFPVLNEIQTPVLVEGKADKAVWITNDENRFSSRHVMVLRLAVQERLRTHDRMQIWNPSGDFKFQYSNKIWKYLKGRMKVTGLKDSWKEIIATMVLYPHYNQIWSILNRLFLAAAVYILSGKKDSGDPQWNLKWYNMALIDNGVDK